MKKFKNLVKQIKFIFDKKQKIQLFYLLLVIIFTSFVELLGVTAIIPLIQVMTDPESIHSIVYLEWVYQLFRFENTTYFLIFLAVVLILIYWVKNVLVGISYNLQFHFTFSNQKKMAYKMLDCYLNQPYYFHLEHSSSDLIRNINTDIVMMYQAVLAVIQLFAELFMCTVLGVYLFIKDVEITLILLVFMLSFVIFFIKKFKVYLRKIGEEDRKYAADIVKWLQQSFGGLKETKIMHRENYFLSMFEHNYSQWANLEQIYRNLQVIPKPIMESLCITAIMLAIIIKLIGGTDQSYFITTISAFAVAAFRLLPSFNRIANYISALLFNFSSFEAVYNDLRQVEEIAGKNRAEERECSPLKFNEAIKIKGLSYRYPSGEENVLEEVSFEIPKNKSVALIGPSGAGKTTLADLILGALEPTSGKILIDNADAFENLFSWQANVGYIPQNIYLMDDSIKNNIVYGAESEIDETRLNHAIERAQLRELIDSLADGVETSIGERGIRLSGGQRQRIGVARALYNDPDVLVLDEATSALDNDTEQAVMDAIESLAGSKTLIIIAHRLSTIQNCDIVFEVKDKGVHRTEAPSN
ncbi:MAG: ABC transporter ATP-binding protein [Lachnospiraceae bacterium]|nr:ABC transporter ATP-binding protein [Lachnospiraceae bacterium]